MAHYQRCKQVREWQRACPREEPLTLSVNLSGLQFMEPDIVERVGAILDATGFDPHTLNLEMTETMLADGFHLLVSLPRNDIDLARAALESGADGAVLRAERAVLRELSDILGLLQHTGAVEEGVPEEIQKMVQARSAAREAKDWARADELRAAIEEAGYLVEDTGAGSAARKAKT